MPINPKFVSIGAHMARKLFEKRSRPGRRNVEVHLTEVEVAAMCALAAEQGARAPTTIIRLPKGDGRRLPSMASIHCGPPLTELATPRVEQKPFEPSHGLGGAELAAAVAQKRTGLPAMCPPGCDDCRGGGPCTFEDP